jgi:hypothetical protein
MMPGAFFALASFVAVVCLCALMLPIDRGDFWKGAFIGWGMCVGITIILSATVFISMKVMP